MKNEMLETLHATAMKLDRRARRFELKIKETLTTAELTQLEKLEAEADAAFDAYRAAYRKAIAA